MKISNQRMALVCAALAVCNVMVAAAAQAQSVSFQAALSFAAGDHPDSVAVGDFNGDGALDLAVANHDSNNASVLVGNGDGSFRAAQNFGAGSLPFSVAVGDFNGDGLPDLALANFGSNDVSVLINDTGL